MGAGRTQPIQGFSNSKVEESLGGASYVQLPELSQLLIQLVSDGAQESAF